jgi:hypothetical protein
MSCECESCNHKSHLVAYCIGISGDFTLYHTKSNLSPFELMQRATKLTDYLYWNPYNRALYILKEE